MTESAVVSTPQRWDIFCTVVDNFGDIGVCWRLARQLVSEHGLSVRLWVDDLASFQRLCPMLRICAQQWLAGVEVRHWLPGPHDATGEVADVVIEAFACTIPAGYLAAMAERVKQGGRAPLWLNLEYLTAEPWAGEYHRLPSVEPRTGLRKYFFIPGFVPETGGLIREESLPGERDALQRNPAARADFLDSLGVRPASESLLMTLFAYETPALAGLLDALQTSPRLVHLLVPEGRITSLVQDWLGEALTAGQPSTRGQLCVQGIPFLPQPDYDRLLWCADFNCVRGEDSLVRALWAARPLLWQCYPQAENGHLVKMQALLDLYLHHLPEEPARLMASLWRAWNEGDAKTIQCCWPAWLNCLPELLMSAHHYASVLNSRPDLARQLLQFHAELL